MAAAFQLTGLVPNRNELLLGKLLQEGVIRERHIRVSPLVSFEDLGLVHSSDYIESVLHPEMLMRIYGYEVGPKEGDDLLLAQRRGVGGTIAAAQAVLHGEIEIGINAGGGFHHAEATKGSGYCVFNDVAVAVAKLRTEGYTRPIAIVDLDFHQGNGNLSIFKTDPSVLTYSIHGAVWDPSVGKADEEIPLSPGATDADYLSALKKTLAPALKAHKPGLVFYLAGNDVLAGDRLGTFALTPKGVLARDIHVFETVRALGARLVVTLAGGYSPLAWQCTANFVYFLRTGKARPRTDWEPDLRAKFTEIAKNLDIDRLQTEDPIPDTGPLSESELLGDLGTLSRPRQFLDYYSRQGLEFAFEKYGIFGKIRKHGYTNLALKVDVSDLDKQILRIHADPDEQVLLELVVNRQDLVPPPETGISGTLKLLNINWLLLQRPSAQFDSYHPKLPGQRYPGLGVAEEIQELLVRFCVRTGLDGLMSTPSHYHGAAVASRWSHFLDPVREGHLLAMRQVLFRFHIWAASELVENGGLRFGDGTPCEWQPSEQILPVSRRLKDYFESPEYREIALRECQKSLLAGLQVIPEKVTLPARP